MVIRIQCKKLINKKKKNLNNLDHLDAMTLNFGHHFDGSNFIFVNIKKTD
jgi:hypothetical protein